MFSVTDTGDVVTIRLEGEIRDDQEVDDFLERWAQIFQTKSSPYILVFDTYHALAKLTYLQHCWKLASFLKKIKESNPNIHAVQHTYIYVRSDTIRALVDAIFKFYQPVSPVSIIVRGVIPCQLS